MNRSKVLLVLAIGLVAMLALVPASALGGGPERDHQRIIEVDEDVDVCGVNVDIVARVVFTDLTFFDKDGNFVRFMSPVSGKVTYTADDGRQVVERFANLFVAEETVDEAAGTLTVLLTFKGLPDMLKPARGGVVLRDAGFAIFEQVIDLATGEELSFELILSRGPHPLAESDFTIFCDAFLEALG